MKSDKQHPDIDSGYAFLVAIAAGICHFLTLGFSMAFGSYYVIFLEVFQKSKGLTAWISAINYGMMCAIGPVASLMIKYQGCRVTIFFGGILSALGLITSAFAESVTTLVFTFGLLAGTGYGFAFTGCIVVMSEYFRKYRVFTMGLSLAGGGLGNIVFPWILDPLLKAYDWRWALALTGAITLHICAAAMLMRPISTGKNHRTPKQKTTKKEEDSEEGKQSCTQRTIRGADIQLFSECNFWQVCINTLLYCFSMSVLYTHIASFSLELGMSLHERNMVLSSLGFSGLLGRLVLGGLALLRKVNKPMLFSVCYFLAGVAVILIAVQVQFVTILVFATVYGFFAAAYGPLLSEVTFMVCGQDRFATGYGWVMLFMGVGQVAGAPAAGFLYDFTFFYPGSFYLAGSTLIVASLATLPYSIQRTRLYKRHFQLEENAIHVHN